MEFILPIKFAVYNKAPAIFKWQALCLLFTCEITMLFLTPPGKQAHRHLNRVLLLMQQVF